MLQTARTRFFRALPSLALALVLGLGTGSRPATAQDCEPVDELCNGLDDDCDEQVDEGFQLGEPCDNGQLGLCYQTGVLICDEGGLGAKCSAPTVEPQSELCNSLDDDCDGVPDDDFPELHQPCDNGELGVCNQTGEFVCEAGGLGVECSLTSSPSPPSIELCNGLDDDCDGLSDESGACDPDWIFGDDFETGDPDLWSFAAGA